MANFEQSYAITMGHEGGYDNDPDDVGGETYKGVSRKYYPDWEGWVIIDNAKSGSNFPNNISNNLMLEKMVKLFYRRYYWNLFCGDDVLDQQLANELFDTGVNMGVTRAVDFLQKALNILNRNESLYSDIEEDGKFGNETMKALNAYLATDGIGLLLKIINILQGMHYIEYARKNPKQERFMRGWMNRVGFIKN